LKVSKNLDFSLVSNKNLSEILPSSGLSRGPDEVAYKYFTYDITYKKPKTKKIFILINYNIC